MLTAEAVTTTQEAENITVLKNYFDQCHLQPKSVVGDQTFMTETWEHFYQSLDITPIFLAPNTPWPNRAEAAVRLLSAQLKIMFHLIKSGNAPATLKKVTYRQLVKAAATVRNQTVTYGGVTLLELAFGRRPADLIQLDVAHQLNWRSTGMRKSLQQSKLSSCPSRHSKRLVNLRTSREISLRTSD